MKNRRSYIKGRPHKNVKPQILNKSKKEKLDLEREAKRHAKEEALQCYNKKKINSFKKLTKKTKRGQPNLNARIELLLNKIQN
ncbi:unnamed protein product [Gordionus sp. m RMFG-2023]